jgi:hypothetical protein
MRRILVDYNTREFVRRGVQSIAISERLNPGMRSEWQLGVGDTVLLVDHDGCEYEALVAHGQMFEWVGDIRL